MISSKRGLLSGGLVLTAAAMICGVMSSKIVAKAANYEVEIENNIVNIDIPDEYEVITRDNLSEHEESIVEMGESIDSYYRLMVSDSVYLTAFVYDEENDVTHTIYIVAEPTLVDDYSSFEESLFVDSMEEVVRELVQEGLNVTGLGKYDTDYARYYIMQENDGGYVLRKYFTVVNKMNYLISMQSNVELSDENIATLESVVNSAKYTSTGSNLDFMHSLHGDSDASDNANNVTDSAVTGNSPASNSESETKEPIDIKEYVLSLVKNRKFLAGAGAVLFLIIMIIVANVSKKKRNKKK